MALSAIAKIYLGRIGRGEATLAQVPAHWSKQVADALTCAGRPTKAELLEVAALLGLDVPDGATNPEIAALIQAFAE